MALYTFPPSPNNGDKYPLNPLPGQAQYEWSATDFTWRLLGDATGVVPGCYGDAYNVPSFCVNAQGQIESVTNVTILTPGGTVTDVTAGIGLLGGTITLSGTIDLDTAYTDTLYLGLGGGTMTGDITFSGTQTFPGVLPLSGGVMTGDITFSGTQTFPNTVTSVTAGIGLLGGTITSTGTIDLDTAYTDTLYLGLAGGTMTGDITFSGTQTFPNTVTSVTAGIGLLGGTITSTGTIDLDTTYTDTLYLSLGGGVMTGDITFSATQTFPPQDLATVTTAGNTTTNTITVGGLTAAGLIYPTSDGTPGQIMTTDGSGNLGWSSSTRVVATPMSSASPGNVGDVAFSNQYFYWYDSGFGWRRILGSAF